MGQTYKYTTINKWI